MTDKFVEKLSENVQKKCRIVDIINCDEIFCFYTIDLDLNALTIDEEESDSQNFFNADEITRKMINYQKRIKRNKNIDDTLGNHPKKNFGWILKKVLKILLL